MATPLAPPSLADDAAFWYGALAMGLASRAEVTAWADAHLTRLEQPPTVLCDIATAGALELGGVLSLLGTLAMGADADACSRRLLLAACHRSPHLTDSAFIDLLSRLATVLSPRWAYVAGWATTWADPAFTGWDRARVAAWVEATLAQDEIVPSRADGGQA